MAKKKPHRFLIYIVLRSLAAVLCLLPPAWAYAFARTVARGLYPLFTRQRERALENLRRAYGHEKSEAELNALARRVFENLAQTAVEVIYFETLTWEKLRPLVEAEAAFQVYDELFREGKGVIMLMAHLGNWELLGAVVCLKGYPGWGVARRIYYEPYNRWIVRLRKAVKINTIYRDEATAKLIEALKRNALLGLLPDQDMDKAKGIFVEFFGRPAYTLTAPARIALVAGAPIVPSFLVRIAGGRYRVVTGPVIRPEIHTTRQEAISQMTIDWMQSLEKVVREYPDQWMWVHNRWRTQPSAVTPAEDVIPAKAGIHGMTPP